MGQRVLKTLPINKPPGAFSLHYFTSARLWLTPEESASLLCSEFHVNTHQVLFSVTGWSSFLSQSPSSIKRGVFFLGKLCSGWGAFSLVLCRLFDMLQTQQLSFNPWGLRNSQPTCGGEARREGRRNVRETQIQHNVFFLRNFIKAPIPVTSPSSNASSFALNQSWLVVVGHMLWV